MKKLIKWLKDSDRYKHLIGGVLIGFVPCHWCDGVYASAVAGLCLEFKDKEHGGSWDWIDTAMTIAGGAIGATLRLLTK